VTNLTLNDRSISFAQHARQVSAPPGKAAMSFRPCRVRLVEQPWRSPGCASLKSALAALPGFERAPGIMACQQAAIPGLERFMAFSPELWEHGLGLCRRKPGGTW
jgi:hypothetical protein